MVTTLYLIRHGETAGGDAKRYHGSIDILLSERGKEQAAEKAALLRRYIEKATTSKHLSYLKDIQNNADSQNAANSSGLRAIYCSGLARAVQSAEIIAEQFGLVPIRIAEEVAVHARAILLADMRARRGLYQRLGMEPDYTVDFETVEAYYNQFK